jgi:energy-coupling factor transporter ATP-binding protein EcfA2
MSNPIKYSTGTESLALKKGNFYIGTGDVGKGPTSITGYYNGITPPSGGYTIYLNKETGGPSIYTVSNDTQLISLTNSIAGQSYTTANECLVYFAGQTDKMVLNRNYEGIVTDGLVFNLDAGFTPSYPKNGTTWYDVSGSNNGTLTNGPTFNSGDGGSIVFDGSNDYVDCGNTLSFVDGLTVQCWVYFNSLNRREIFIGKGNGQNAAGTEYWIEKQSNNTILLLIVPVNNNGPTDLRLILNNSQVQNNTWYFMCLTYNRQVLKGFINGIENSAQVNLSFPMHVTDKKLGVGRLGDLGNLYLSGKISNSQIYNRALTATEVLQNYNATKGRFGL